MTTYPLQSGDAGAARLALLARVHEAPTNAFFDRIGIAADAACLDLGCGAGAVTRLLAARVPSGRVVGVELDGAYVECARRSAEGTPGPIELVQGSAYELAYEAAFDIVYARFLLTHLREPLDVLRRMVRATKPGGVIAVEDVDFGAAFCHPHCAEFDRYLAWYDTMTRSNGGDPNFGRALYTLMSDVGISKLSLTVSQPTFAAGPEKDLAALTLEHIGHTLVDKGIATREEVEATTQGLRAFAADPRTLVSMPRIFQVSGVHLAA